MKNGGCFLVTEFMDGGSLDRACGLEDLPRCRRLGCSVFRSCSTSWMALAYLHLMHKSVHLDLKSPNILLEKIVSNDDAGRSDRSVTHRAKIADFGLSKIFNKGKQKMQATKMMKKESSKDAIKAANWKSMQLVGFVGTPRWMAPEMMQTNTKIGPSVDIYSFGVVMWEVWSRRKPWSELSNNQEIFKAVRDEKRTLSLPENEDAPDGYDDLMRRCCAYKANQRPLID